MSNHRLLDVPDIEQLLVFLAFMASITLVRAIHVIILIGRLYHVNLSDYIMYIHQTINTLNIVDHYF